jgi:hypothetical protein
VTLCRTMQIEQGCGMELLAIQLQLHSGARGRMLASIMLRTMRRDHWARQMRASMHVSTDRLAQWSSEQQQLCSIAAGRCCSRSSGLHLTCLGRASMQWRPS